jgi:hypothetical protein
MTNLDAGKGTDTPPNSTHRTSLPLSPTVIRTPLFSTPLQKKRVVQGPASERDRVITRPQADLRQSRLIKRILRAKAHEILAQPDNGAVQFPTSLGVIKGKLPDGGSKRWPTNAMRESTRCRRPGPGKEQSLKVRRAGRQLSRRVAIWPVPKVMGMFVDEKLTSWREEGMEWNCESETVTED